MGSKVDLLRDRKIKRAVAKGRALGYALSSIRGLIDYAVDNGNGFTTCLVPPGSSNPLAVIKYKLHDVRAYSKYTRARIDALMEDIGK